jgi:hypothetical protein
MLELADSRIGDRPPVALADVHRAAVIANWRAFHIGIPEGFAPYVYRYRDFAGNLIYVGMTSNAAVRADTHLKESDWCSWVASVEYRRCRSRDDAFKLESRIRDVEHPLFVRVDGYAALMADVDATHRVNHVTGSCTCILDSELRDLATHNDQSLLAFADAWRDEGELQKISDRFLAAGAAVGEQERWRGGRAGYGAKPVPSADGGTILVAATDTTAPVVAEAACRVIAGDTVMSVIADLNRRGVPSHDGVLWSASQMRKILRNPILAELHIIPSADFEKLQAALDARKQVHSPVREPGRNYLGLVYCASCGGKIYRWYQKRVNAFRGRCRNELKRYEVASPCDMPMVPYELINDAIRYDVEQEHGGDLIETRLASATGGQRADEITRELMTLAGKFTAKTIGRDAYLARQAALMDEAETLRDAASASRWTRAVETVGQRWERLSDEDGRLWLVQLGVCYMVTCEARPIYQGDSRWKPGVWTVTPFWPPHAADTALERLVPSPVETDSLVRLPAS